MENSKTSYWVVMIHLETLAYKQNMLPYAVEISNGDHFNLMLFLLIPIKINYRHRTSSEA